MGLSVENVCGLLIRSRLLSVDEVKAMYQRWLAEGHAAGTDLDQFLPWLVHNRYVTDYQAGLLARGHADHFFLGEYKVLERVGRGRMAGVYRAVHQLGQVVAIKVLPPSRAREGHFLARFQREAALALRLNHPNIVRAFQTGSTNGLHYLVMEYLDGEPLDEVMQRRGPLPPQEAVRLIHQALLGLQHVHEQGMVHRDLKPANLMLVPNPGAAASDDTPSFTVKILDIGLGKALYDENAPAALGDVNLTGEGVILGTPDYLAPEQARNPQKTDIRADVYSLGCVLYHALTGRKPFVETNLIKLMARHASEMPPLLREFNLDVPDGLQQIVNWMLAKDPAQRYPTPARAAQALEVFLVAGNRPEVAEADPTMSSYLGWLQQQGNGNPAPVSASPAAPVAAAPEPDVPRSERRLAQQKKRRPAGEAALPAESYDVELVGLPPPAPVEARRVWQLDRRDFLMMALGAGGVIGAAVVGFLVQRLVSWLREPR
jgi:serine/threonine protein kinase